MKCLKQIVMLVLFILPFTVQQTHALDDPSFSVNATNSQKGTLSMNELFIGGIKSFENVKVEFDFSNSTFTVLQATPADNSIPAQAVEIQEAGGLSVGLRGCVSLDRSVTCHLLLTSNEFDRSIRFWGSFNSETTVFDNLDNEYRLLKVTIANSEGNSTVDKFFVADVTTEATIVFDNLSTRADNFSLLVLGFTVDNTIHNVKFRDVAF